MGGPAPGSHENRSQKGPGPGSPPPPVPPYLPISCSGLMTSGSCPMRSATGGSLPALTSSASCGASLNVLGNFAGSVTTSGPSRLPIKLLLEAAPSAPTATTALSTPATRATRQRSVMTLPLSRLSVRIYPSRLRGLIIVIFERQVQGP